MTDPFPDIDEKPDSDGWYGLVFVADEGEGFAPAVWGVAELWEGGKWRQEPLCGGWRSAKAFETKAEALDWAQREASYD